MEKFIHLGKAQINRLRSFRSAGVHMDLHWKRPPQANFKLPEWDPVGLTRSPISPFRFLASATAPRDAIGRWTAHQDLGTTIPN